MAIDGTHASFKLLVLPQVNPMKPFSIKIAKNISLFTVRLYAQSLVSFEFFFLWKSIHSGSDTNRTGSKGLCHYVLI